jgi:hypothetical protein
MPTRPTRPHGLPVAPVELAVGAAAAGSALLVGHHLRNGPLVLAGVVGLVAAIGGAVVLAARAQRQTLEGEADRETVTWRLRGLALVTIPTTLVVVALAQAAPSGWPRSLILGGFCAVWIPVAAVVATRGRT